MANETLYQTVWLLLHDEEFLRAHSHLRANVFPRGSLRYLVDLSLKHWNLHHKLITKTVVDAMTEFDSAQLRRSGADKDQVRGVFVDLSLAYLMPDDALPAMRQLCHKWLERRVLESAVERAGKAIESGDVDGARFVLSNASLREATTSEGFILSDTSPDHLKAISAPPAGCIPTGFDELDKAWEGGYCTGQLGMVVAPTGVGKSMMLAYMAAQALWRGADVLMWSGELTPQQLGERITLAMLEKGKRDLTQTWDRELARAARLRGLNAPPSFHLDIRGDTLTWPDLSAMLEEYKSSRGAYPDVLLLDSADDIAPYGKFNTAWESLKGAFTHLRSLAQEKGLRVWTSGQLTREAVEKARVSLRNIGDAFAKAQKSHYVLGFAQTEQDKNDARGPRMTMYVLKDSLHGTTGARLDLGVSFGSGLNGYPGFEVRSAFGLS